MRLQSEKKVTVKNKVFGGPIPLICLPLVAKEDQRFYSQTAELTRLDPDLLEWRIDGYEQVEDISACLEALQALKAAMGSIPLIFTCRIHSEGGVKDIIPGRRDCSSSPRPSSRAGVEIIDVEMCNETAFIEKVKTKAQSVQHQLILSYHNFDQTPDETFIHDKLVMAQDMGADIAKLAVMPKRLC